MDDEIGRGRLREVGIRQLTEENQPLKSTGEAVTAVTRSVQSDRHLVPNGLLPDIVDDNYHPHKKGFGHTLYGNADKFWVISYRSQKKVEPSHQTLHNMQIRSRPTVHDLSNCSPSMVATINSVTKVELNNLEISLVSDQPHLQHRAQPHKPVFTTASETSRQQIDPTGHESAAEQPSKFLPTRGLSGLPQESDSVSVDSSSPNETTPKGAELGSHYPIHLLPLLHLHELDPDISSEDEYVEINQSSSGERFHFGSPSIQARPILHRVSASTEQIEQKGHEACLIPMLNTWEWSSVPDLQLWHPKR